MLTFWYLQADISFRVIDNVIKNLLSLTQDFPLRNFIEELITELINIKF